eukprot:1002514-Amphidinium_carterae.1
MPASVHLSYHPQLSGPARMHPVVEPSKKTGGTRGGLHGVLPDTLAQTAAIDKQTNDSNDYDRDTSTSKQAQHDRIVHFTNFDAIFLAFCK